MAGITLAHAEAQLAVWLSASSALATSQSYEINTGNGSRKLTRVDAGEVRENIKFWDGIVKSLSDAAGAGAVLYAGHIRSSGC
jgi:hypothetical protein